MTGRHEDVTALLQAIPIDIGPLLQCGVLNPEWYAARYDGPYDRLDMLREFFLDPGCRAYSPSVYFDSDFYLAQNPDVEAAGINPLVHYVMHGEAEGRCPNPLFDPAYYRRAMRERGSSLQQGTLLVHYLRDGLALGLPTSRDFHPQRYLAAYPDVAAAGEEPLAHFLTHGGREGRSGNGAVAGSTLKPRAAALGASLLGPALRAPVASPGPYPCLEHPWVSVVVPCYNSPPDHLRACIDSVLAQSHRSFELIVVDDASPQQAHHPLLEQFEREGICVVRATRNGGISRASNLGATRARGEWLLFLDHDDLLDPGALAALAERSRAAPSAQYIYSDCARISAGGEILDYHYKPDWSPELLLTYMYAGQVLCLRRDLFERLGGFDHHFDGCQDHDLALRVAEANVQVEHIATVLYYWRAIPGSTALAARYKDYAHKAARRAIGASLKRRQSSGRAKAAPWAAPSRSNFFQIGFNNGGPAVTILIPTRDNTAMLARLLDSIGQRTLYRNYRVLVLADEDVGPDTRLALEGLNVPLHWGRFVDGEGRFSFSRKMNVGVELAETEFVLLLNDDMEVVSPNWLSDMMGIARLDGVGTVGAQLCYPDGSLQHGGVTVGLEGGRAGHVLKGLPPGDEGYLSYRAATRNVFGVTAACMLVRRALYQEVGGFNEHDYSLAYNDVDFCARVSTQGWRHVYVGHAVLLHFEGTTRQRQDRLDEVLRYTTQYGAARDPYWSPHWDASQEAPYPLRAMRRSGAGGEPVFYSHNTQLQGATKVLAELAVHLAGETGARFYVPEGPVAYRRLHDQFRLMRTAGVVAQADDIAELQRRLREVEAELLAARPSCVFCNTLLSVLVVVAAIRLGLPVVWIIHESEGHDFFEGYAEQIRHYLLPFAMTHADRVVFVSQDCRNRYREYDLASNMLVIRNGSVPADAALLRRDRNELRRELGLPESGQIVLSVGTLCERKAQARLVDLAQELENRGVLLDLHFVVLGADSGDYLALMQAKVDRLGFYRERFMFHDVVDDPAPFYCAADLFMMTSNREAYPTVLTEALAHGLPVLTTPVEGAADIVFNKALGSILPFEDIEGWIVALQLLLEGASSSRRASAVAAAAVLPGWSQVAQRYRTMLSGILDDRAETPVPPYLQ
jgi:GT2 family glycosyltransferase/glycosyltransferase involved in cell wall biosynthesis